MNLLIHCCLAARMASITRRTEARPVAGQVEVTEGEPSQCHAAGDRSCVAVAGGIDLGSANDQLRGRW